MSRVARILQAGTCLAQALFLLAPLAGTAAAQSKKQQKKDAEPAPTAGKQSQTKLSEMSPAVRVEIDRLISNDPAQRASGAASLGEMGERARPAIPYLIAVLTDLRSVFSLEAGKTEVRVVALNTLRKLGQPAVQALLAGVGAPLPATRLGSAWALGDLKPPGAVDALLAQISRETVVGAGRDTGSYTSVDDVVSEIADALAHIGDVRAVPVLISIVNRPVDKDSSNQYLAGVARSLGTFKTPASFAPLLDLAERFERVEGSVFQQERVLEALATATAQPRFRNSKAAREWLEKNAPR